LTTREKAEKDLRSLLKQNPGSSSKPSSSSMTSSSGSGAVPGLMNPPISRHSPQQESSGNQSGVMGGSVINSAPGQGRSSIGQTRQQQYQPTISAVDSMGIPVSPDASMVKLCRLFLVFEIFMILRFCSLFERLKKNTGLMSYKYPIYPGFSQIINQKISFFTSVEDFSKIKFFRSGTHQPRNCS